MEHTMPPTLYIVRHTLVAVGPTMCYGASDVTLAEHWEQDFERVWAKLPHDSLQGFDLYSSPLKRCATLATYLGERAPLDATTVHFDDRLKEMDFGDWEFTPWADISPSQRAHWMSNIADHAPPGGESFGEVAARADAWLAQARIALAEHKLPGALVVTHGGVIRALLANLLGCTIEQGLRLNVDYGGITAVELGKQTRIKYVNR
jgi:alpha-ribazole phosphatase